MLQLSAARWVEQEHKRPAADAKQQYERSRAE
jgi:hypothetical protein